MDFALLEKQLAQVMQAAGLNIEGNPARESTPKRVLKYWMEQNDQESRKFAWTEFESGYDQMVIQTDIHFASSCEHHLLPFFGRVHIAYIPNGKIVGLSKLNRAVDYHSRSFQTQEHLTNNIAQNIAKQLECESVGIVIEAEHTCISCRGIRSYGSKTATDAFLGAFKNDVTRNEFLSRINK